MAPRSNRRLALGYPRSRFSKLSNVYRLKRSRSCPSTQLPSRRASAPGRDHPGPGRRDAVPLEVRAAGRVVQAGAAPRPPALPARRVPPRQHAPRAALHVERHAQPVDDGVRRDDERSRPCRCRPGTPCTRTRSRRAAAPAGTAARRRSHRRGTAAARCSRRTARARLGTTDRCSCTAMPNARPGQLPSRAEEARHRPRRLAVAAAEEPAELRASS